MSRSPHIVILAGPNGAGKSTAADVLLQDTLGVDEFVNADIIAKGISAFHPESAAIQAGRLMINQLARLAERHANFACETTLSGKTLARFLERIHQDGYKSHLLYLWLPSADLAVKRVQTRVKLGGHSIHEETIRRRYVSSLRNFENLYRPMTTTWRVYDNHTYLKPVLVASGTGKKISVVENSSLWNKICTLSGWSGENNA